MSVNSERFDADLARLASQFPGLICPETASRAFGKWWPSFE